MLIPDFILHLGYHDISGLIPDSSSHIKQLQFEDDWYRKLILISSFLQSNCTNCPGYQPLGYPTTMHSSFSISTPLTATDINAVTEDVWITCFRIIRIIWVTIWITIYFFSLFWLWTFTGDLFLFYSMQVFKKNMIWLLRLEYILLVLKLFSTPF